MELKVSNEVKQQVISVLGSENAAKVFELVAKAPTHFIGIREYVSGITNKKCVTPSISNITVQMGNMATKAALDLETLKNVSVSEVMQNAVVDEKTAAIAIAEVRKSLENKILGEASTDGAYQARREGQENAYINLGNGFRLHIGDGESNGELHFSAFEVGKQVVQQGTYLPTNSRAKTIAKNWITKGLKTSKFRTYRIKFIDQLHLAGECVEV